MATVEPKYVMKKIEIHNKNVNKDFFIYDDERRKIRTGKVKGLLKSFDDKNTKKRHFDSPFVVNTVGKQMRVVDGNHRIEAIKQKIAKTPGFSIIIWVAEYKNLNRNEERMVFTKWNSGTPESSTDYLKYYWQTLPYGKEILKALPVSIYGSNTTQKVKALVGSHVLAKKQNNFEGGHSAGGEQTVADFMTVLPADIRVMKEFCSVYEEIFGPIFQRHPWYRTTPYQAFYRIWYDNRLDVPTVDFVNLWQKVFVNKLVFWDDLMRSGGRSACQTFYKIALRELNNASKKFNWKESMTLP